MNSKTVVHDHIHKSVAFNTTAHPTQPVLGTCNLTFILRLWYIYIYMYIIMYTQNGTVHALLTVNLQETAIATTFPWKSQLIDSSMGLVFRVLLISSAVILLHDPVYRKQYHYHAILLNCAKAEEQFAWSRVSSARRSSHVTSGCLLHWTLLLHSSKGQDSLP